MGLPVYYSGCALASGKAERSPFITTLLVLPDSNNSKAMIKYSFKQGCFKQPCLKRINCVNLHYLTVNANFYGK